MTTVCTGFHPAGYEDYARDCLRSLNKFWGGLDLLVYTEEPVRAGLPMGEERSLWDCDGASEFVERHRDNLAVRGKAPYYRKVDGMKQPIDLWSPKDHRQAAVQGAAWRFDAMRWFKQCMIPEHAAADLPDGDILCWLDADVVAYKPIRPNLIEDLLGDADLCYLGRPHGSEIGFWAVRLGPLTRKFLGRFAGMYRDDKFFDQKEWHSAYLFDRVRGKFEDLGMKARNLTAGGSNGHIWFDARSPLRDCGLDHLKGDRKRLGRSPERQL